MFSGGAYSIKDLKDLSVLLVRRCYRHAGPKGPEEMFFARAIAWDRPPHYGPERGSPRHAPFGSRRSRTTVASSDKKINNLTQFWFSFTMHPV